MKIKMTASQSEYSNPATSLDPQTTAEWVAMRAQAHRMLDDMLDHIRDLRAGPVWQVSPPSVREQFHESLPQAGQDLSTVHQQFLQNILPYGIGNAHPGFMGWVQGGGTTVGMLAEMLAAGLNANVGGRDQIPVVVEQQITAWMRELFGFPATASGLFVTGASMANLMAVWVARVNALGLDVRMDGVAGDAKKLVAYTSTGAHGCIAQAMDLAGFGTGALRTIAVNAQFEMDTDALRAAITADRLAGFTPFLIAATAGTVDVGAIDDLSEIGRIAREEALWFHIDGATGALAMLTPTLAPKLAGLSQADSIALDFHKWGQVPYDAGFLLVRDGTLHHDSYAAPAAYLRRDSRGMAASSPWPCDFGPDLSRNFRALKVWFSFKVFGAKKMGEMIAHTCQLAQDLKAQIVAHPSLELLAPVALNIVCFRFLPPDLAEIDALNANIVADLQEAGVCAPSATTINGQLAIRAAIVNHRTTKQDIDALVAGTLAMAARRLGPRPL